MARGGEILYAHILRRKKETDRAKERERRFTCNEAAITTESWILLIRKISTGNDVHMHAQTYPLCISCDTSVFKLLMKVV